MNLEELNDSNSEKDNSLDNEDVFEESIKQDLWESEKSLISDYFKKGSKILDIGCGRGRLTLPLSKLGNEVVGIDTVPGMIDIARKTALNTDLNLTYRISRTTKIDFEDGHFDYAIFANNGWGEIPGKKQRADALKEICRILKSEGTFILCVHQRYYFGWIFFFWLERWIEFYILQKIGVSLKELDFGDIFLTKNRNGEKLKQRRFVHMTGASAIKRKLKTAGFQIESMKRMGDISQIDAKNKRGSLYPGFKVFKSPVFYVCRKKAIL